LNKFDLVPDRPGHAHAALFGVYGLLSLGLVLVARTLGGQRRWNERPLGVAFLGP
jgi:nitric oxide reductase subunit B